MFISSLLLFPDMAVNSPNSAKPWWFTQYLSARFQTAKLASWGYHLGSTPNIFLQPFHSNPGFALVYISLGRSSFTFSVFACLNLLTSKKKISKLAQIPAAKLHLIRLRNYYSTCFQRSNPEMLHLMKEEAALTPCLLLFEGFPSPVLIWSLQFHQVDKPKNKWYSHPNESKVKLIWFFYNNGRYLKSLLLAKY